MSEKRVSFLGPHGTFTEEAAHYFFREDATYIPCASIPDTLDAADSGKTDYAIAPLENSIEGSVNLTLDWLIHESHLPILAELVMPISQHLFAANPDVTSSNAIRKLYSHPQPVAQCRDFIKQHLPDVEIEYVSSTAEAAKIVSLNREEPWAAIGTRLSREIYDLHFINESIEDYANNYTRFIVVGSEMPEACEPSEQYRTTIVVTLPEDFPGALHQVLAAFAWRRMNLSRIESRPTKKGLGSYYFLVDIEQKMDDVLLPGAFAEIEALGCTVKRLGTYPYFVKSMERMR